MAAIIPLILKFLPYLIQASESIPQITTFLASLHDIFKRDKSWTAEEEKAFDEATEELRNDPYWQVSD